MDLSILARRGAQLTRRLSDWRLGRTPGSFSSVLAEFQDLASLDAQQCALEAVSSADKDPEARNRAQRLLKLACDAAEMATSARWLDERQSHERSQRVDLNGEAYTLAGAARWVRQEPTRDLRALASTMVWSARQCADAPLARRVSETQELAATRGHPGPVGFRSVAEGIDFARLGAEARAVLAATEDAYRDLLGFALRKCVGRVAPLPRGEAAEHDLARFSRLEPFDDLFPARRLVDWVQSALPAMGLAWNAEGRIDFEPLEDEAEAISLVAPIRVPDEIHVRFRRDGGASDYVGLLRLFGHAHLLAGLDPGLPIADRWLVDEAAGEACGLLISSCLLDPAFLVRSLGADRRVALEAARFLAIGRLVALRSACAQLLYEQVLYAEGPKEDLKGLYREIFRKALLVEWPLAGWLWSVEPLLACSRSIRGAAVAGALGIELLEEANADWWRNPGTAVYLKRAFGRAALGGADAMAADPGKLSAEKAAAALVEAAAR